jgi:hypothetical protein
MHSSGVASRENAEVCPRVIASASEAIQHFRICSLDCFVAIAPRNDGQNEVAV